MNKNDEKMQALEVLKKACESVTRAMDAIDSFAATHGMAVKLEKKPRHVTIPELADMVAEGIGMKPECALAAIESAIDLIGDLDLLVDVEGKENDE